MKEIEVKILDIDKERVISQLEALGAQKTLDCEMCASYFDFDDKRLEKEKKFLRLRTKGDCAELTLKQKISTEAAKIMEEHEVEFEDVERMTEILHALGLKEFKKDKKKHRIEYVMGNVHFEIDTHQGIPSLLEIEGTTIEDVQNAVKLLGFSMSDAKPWSGKKVMEHYRNTK